MSVDSSPRVVGGRYVVSALVGRGGMADVYRATDSVLDRDVAVKMLRASGADASERERFLTEGRLLAQLSHPNLVTLLDVGLDDEAYLVMELVDGPALADADWPWSLDRVADVGHQLAQALACVHAAGVVHRDVKPGNILLGADDRARLTDFGIARLLEDSARFTGEGLTVGTAAYLAPEQVTGDSVGPAADVYSLGLVLLEAITGERAYPGAPIEAAVARLRTPAAIPDQVPPEWQRLLRRMTALSPEHRPGAAEVAASLRQLAAGTGRSATPSVLAPPPALTQRGPSLASVLSAAGVAAAALIMVCVIVLAHAGQGPPAVDPRTSPAGAIDRGAGASAVERAPKPAPTKADARPQRHVKDHDRPSKSHARHGKAKGQSKGKGKGRG